MTVAFDEDLLTPMLAGWQKVASRYGLPAAPSAYSYGHRRHGQDSTDVKGHHATSSTKDSRNTPLLCSSMSERVCASHHAMAAWNHVMRHSNSICDICFLPVARVNGPTNTASARNTCSIVCRATGSGRNPRNSTDLVPERDADLSGRASFGHVTGRIRVSTAAWLCMAQRSSVDGIDGRIAVLLHKVELLTATVAKSF